MYVNSLF